MKTTLLAIVLAIGAASALPVAVSTDASITDITGPIVADVADLLEGLTTALERIPGDLASVTGRSADGGLEAITDITGPIVGEGADLLEGLSDGLEGSLTGLTSALAGPK